MNKREAISAVEMIPEIVALENFCKSRGWTPRYSMYLMATFTALCHAPDGLGADVFSSTDVHEQ